MLQFSYQYVTIRTIIAWIILWSFFFDCSEFNISEINIYLNWFPESTNLNSLSTALTILAHQWYRSQDLEEKTKLWREVILKAWTHTCPLSKIALPLFKSKSEMSSWLCSIMLKNLIWRLLSHIREQAYWRNIINIRYFGEPNQSIQKELDCKVIQLVNPKGNQSWTFVGRTNAEAKTPILWPPDVKNWLLGKDPDAGKYWRQEKGTTEDEVVGSHHLRDGHEFEQALVVGNGQGSLACCSPWGRKKVKHGWATKLNWTDFGEGREDKGKACWWGGNSMLFTALEVNWLAHGC